MSAALSDALAALAAQLPDGAAFLSQLAGPFRRAIRLHPRRGQPQGWGRLERIPWAPAGRFHDAAIDPGSRLDYHAGLAYPQDAASQLPVYLLEPQPGERVLDACAAPGSKSGQLAQALGDSGLLVCCDASQTRRRILRETLARQGQACAVVTPLPLERLAQRAVAGFDAALVDAPCSGALPRSSRQCARMALRQRAILDQAAACVRPGGRLVYSTCTPYEAENEALVATWCAEQPEWSIEACSLPGCDGDLRDQGGLRLWPQRQGCEAFFACRLRRAGPAVADTGLPPGLRGDLPPAWKDPLPITASWWVWAHAGRLFAASPLAAACALPSEARGLLLGRLRERSIEWDLWAAQAMIERGAPATRCDHATACALWAGADCALPAGFVASSSGLPLGLIRHGRLHMPSRLRRSALV